ncbi:unnamed protein product, partial [Nippostrongylus brasiliensis]|uniref:PWI domain-containing protein n=1 Tax=Nippostrongylus brasiliensis TaxID=27835 RepID=A0A0N4Y0Y7_NIPBR
MGMAVLTVLAEDHRTIIPPTAATITLAEENPAILIKTMTIIKITAIEPLREAILDPQCTIIVILGLDGSMGRPPLHGGPPPAGPPPGGSQGPQWFPPPPPFYPPGPFPSGASSGTLPHQSGSSHSSAPSAPFFTMDANARKKLPAWILEGLEKAEREKMKQLEKEERMKKAEEERAKRRALAGKGRFDSSSDEDDDGHADDERSRSKSRQSAGGEDDDGEPVFLAKRHDLPVEDLRTEEEKKDDAMVAVRFIMMSLLMECTDEVLRSSISDCIREAKSEAEPKLLAKSSALAALSSLGGGDESDDESDNDDSKADDKVRAGAGASPSSESGDDSGAFKAPLGVPRKSSKQTTNAPGMRTPPQQLLQLKEMVWIQLKRIYDDLVKVILIKRVVMGRVRINLNQSATRGADRGAGAEVEADLASENVEAHPEIEAGEVAVAVASVAAASLGSEVANAVDRET